MNKICIGTAQFGITGYGITNRDLLIKDSEIKKILMNANKNGITHIDTAQAYGTAETRLGDCLVSKWIPNIINKMQINIDQYNEEEWELNLSKSLNKLQCSRFECYMIHNAASIKKGGELIRWLNKIKERGEINKIGVSIYEKQDLDVIPLSEIDLVQLPVSLHDQRMIDNKTIDILKKNNIEVHARSIYMQGLMLLASKSWPTWIDKKSKEAHQRLEEFCIHMNCSLLEAAISFVENIPHIDKYLVGICNNKQLIELIEAQGRGMNISKKERENFRITNPNILDPRKWPIKK